MAISEHRGQAPEPGKARARPHSLTAQVSRPEVALLEAFQLVGDVKGDLRFALPVMIEAEESDVAHEVRPRPRGIGRLPVGQVEVDPIVDPPVQLLQPFHYQPCFLRGTRGQSAEAGGLFRRDRDAARRGERKGPRPGAVPRNPKSQPVLPAVAGECVGSSGLGKRKGAPATENGGRPCRLGHALRARRERR